jgi:hypothetical protein
MREMRRGGLLDTESVLAPPPLRRWLAPGLRPRRSAAIGRLGTAAGGRRAASGGRGTEGLEAVYWGREAALRAERAVRFDAEATAGGAAEGGGTVPWLELGRHIADGTEATHSSARPRVTVASQALACPHRDRDCPDVGPVLWRRVWPGLLARCGPEGRSFSWAGLLLAPRTSVSVPKFQ